MIIQQLFQNLMEIFIVNDYLTKQPLKVTKYKIYLLLNNMGKRYNISISRKTKYDLAQCHQRKYINIELNENNGYYMKRNRLHKYQQPVYKNKNILKKYIRNKLEYVHNKSINSEICSIIKIQ